MILNTAAWSAASLPGRQPQVAELNLVSLRGDKNLARHYVAAVGLIHHRAIDFLDDRPAVCNSLELILFARGFLAVRLPLQLA
jgi:hypothetical protein